MVYQIPPKKTVINKKTSDFELDSHNANKGTERGTSMLRGSLEAYGAGRAILVDKNGRVIAGNKSLAMAVELGFTDVEVIQTDGTKVVAVQRMDLDLAQDEGTRRLALLDNRVGEINLDWNVEELMIGIAEGIDISALFYEEELEKLLAGLNEEHEPPPPKEPEQIECPNCGHEFTK